MILGADPRADETATGTAKSGPADEIVSLAKAGKLDEAAARASTLLDSSKDLDRDAMLDFAKAVDALTEASFKSGSGPPDAVRLAERAIALKESAAGAETEDAALSNHLLGNLLKARQDLPGAKRHYERALEIRRKVFGEDALEIVPSLNNLGTIAKEEGDLTTATQIYARCVEIREKKLPPERWKDLATSLTLLGEMQTRTGAAAAAEATYQRAVEVQRRVSGRDDFRVAGLMGNIASIWTESGDFTEARELQERVIRILESEENVDPATLGLALNNMGYLLWRTGDLDEAQSYLERALAIRQKNPKGQIDTAQTLNNLAAVAWLRGDGEAGRRRSEEALRILEQAPAGRTHDALMALNNLAVFAADGGEVAAAKRLHERALEIEKREPERTAAERTLTLTNLGDVLSRMGDHEAARDMLREAISLRTMLYGPSHFRLGSTLDGYAVARMRAGDVKEALAAALRAEEIGRSTFTAVAPTLAERQALSWGQVRVSGLGTVLALAGRGLDADGRRLAWEACARSRSLVLEVMLARQRAAVVAADPSVVQATKDLAEKRERLARLVLAGPAPQTGEHYGARVEEARREEEEAERRLAATSTEFRRDRSSREIYLGSTRAALPKGATLVSYFVYADPLTPRTASYLAFVLQPGKSSPDVVTLGSADHVADLVRAWQHAVTSPADETAYRAAAATLRETVWDPLAGKLGGAKRVFVVPDGDLHLVSFATLPSLSGDRYLVEEGPEIDILTSERDLLRASQATRTGRGLLVLAAPDFDTGNDSENHRFAALLGATTEAGEIRTLWEQAHPAGSASFEGCTTWSGAMATETAFKKGAPSTRVVHLATHGFFFPPGQASPPSRIPSTVQETSAGESSRAIAVRNPLLLSGLALAGANRRASAEPGSGTDDGLLTSAEIAGMDLQGVEWAVLSACDTGGGAVVPGEGVLGLQRAFLVAGARTVVMSLWRVQDEFASKWIEQLYRARLADGLATGAAVRKADQAMLGSFRSAGRTTHPFYWGAFIATGDWR